MVLPASSTAAFTLLFLSIICFGLWPIIFRLAGTKWRFELFSVDFALGSIVFAVLAAYTLGTRGSELGFSDSMLVAGQRTQATAVVAGSAFALGNMCYLGAIALIGLSNATLLTFGVFGCSVGLLHLQRGQYATSGIGFVILLAAAGFAWASATGKKAVVEAPKVATAKRSTIRSNTPLKKSRVISLGTKGGITGILAGLAFVGVLPFARMAQSPELGIGAYGGILMASIGVLIATVFADFFFLNISLQGGNIGYATYLRGSLKIHAIGAASGAVWTAGALALYAAYTGAARITDFDAWLAPFGGALIALGAGLLFAQNWARNTVIAAALFVAGAIVLLAGF